MVSSVSFGNFTTINGKNVLAGSQSGIDTTSLINALATAKAKPATDDQAKITANQAKITAYNSLKTLMTTFQSSLDALRNPAGLSSNSTNVFNSRTPFLSMTGSGTASNYVGVTTSNGAPIGKFTIQVDHLATAESDESLSFADRTSSVVNASGTNTAGQFAAGTFQINGINVTLQAGSNLNNVMAAINAATGQSGVSASIVNYGNNDNRLILTGKNTGTANAITITDPNGVLPSSPNAAMFTVKQPANDAQFEFNGQTVTRPSNTISDLLDNTTFTLYAPTGSDVVTADIDKDDQAIATAVGTFVDSYNALRTFFAQQQQRNASGLLVSSAVLNGDPTMNTIMNSLSSFIGNQASIAIPTGYASGNAVTPVRLGDLGITLTDQAAGTTTNSAGASVATPAVSNMLTIDPSTLTKALDSNFDAVANIFEFNLSSTSSNLAIYQRDNTVTTANLGITIDTTQPDGQKASVTSIDGVALTSPIYLNYQTVGTQVLISGMDNTDLSDFSFQYSGNGSETITKTTGLNSKDFELSINNSNPTDSQAQITKIFGATLSTPIGLNYSQSNGSSLISGVAGTSFAGLQMIYTGSGLDTIDATITQGFADQMYNSVYSMLNGTGGNGLIDNAISNLNTVDTNLQTQIDRINTQVTTYRNDLLTKYSNMEAAISSANQLLQLLTAQTNAGLINSGN